MLLLTGLRIYVLASATARFVDLFCTIIDPTRVVAKEVF